MKRPLLFAGLSYACGILLSRYIPLSPLILLPVSFGVLLATLVAARMRPHVVFPLCGLIGWTACSLSTAVISPYDLRRILDEEPVIATVRGTLRETPAEKVYQQGEKESWSSVAQIQLSAIRTNNGSWQPAFGLMAVTTPAMLSSNIFGGQIVEVTGVAAPPKIAVAEGTFDYRAFLAGKGIYYHLQAASEADWQIVSSPPKPPLADRFRNWARSALALGLPGEDETLRLEWALTLGWKQALTEEVSEPFIRAATLHIFAVDGLRMAILTGIIFSILRALRLPRLACALVLLPVIWFYTALTGWPASAIRANIMLTVVITGWMLKRPSDTLNSLFAAAFIILAYDPRQLFQAGFQLSFGVVLGIILVITKFEEWRARFSTPDPFLPERLRPRWRRALDQVIRWSLEFFSGSFAAWLVSVPLVAYYFNIFTPVSTPANMLAIILCCLVLTSNLASLLFAAWLPGIAALFNHTGWALMKCIQITSQWFANWPGAYHYVPRPGLFAIFLFYAILLAIITGWLFRPRLRVWKFAVLTLVLAGSGWHFWQQSNVTRLTILPVNGGTAIFFDAPGSKNDLLIDCGATNSVQFVTKPFLRAQGINRLPALALTHGDLRHVGGAEMTADLFHVQKLCVSPLRFRSPVYRRIVADWSATPEKLLTVSRTNTLGLWTVLHPAANDKFSLADDGSLVLDATFNGSRILLLSDLGKLGQESLLERNTNLRADILVTSLPSQNEPIGDALLDAVQPRLIVVVDSEFPPTERASRAVHERLARRKIPVVYTRFTGAATIEWPDQRWELRTMSGMRFKSWDLAPVPDPLLAATQDSEP